MLVFYFWLNSLAQHYAMQKGVPFDVLMLMTACMMSISVSQRFHQGVQMIWHTPNRWHYLKLFAVFALLTYLAALRAFEPSLLAPAARKMPWLFEAAHEVHSLLHDGALLRAVLSLISCLYVATVS